MTFPRAKWYWQQRRHSKTHTKEDNQHWDTSESENLFTHYFISTCLHPDLSLHNEQPWLSATVVLALTHTYTLSVDRAGSEVSLLVLSPAPFSLVANCEELLKDSGVKTVSEQLHLHLTVSKHHWRCWRVFLLSRFCPLSTFSFLHFSVHFY